MKKSLADTFAERPRMGALQQRSRQIIGALNERNGAPLAEAAAKIGRHTAQLVIEIEKSGAGLVSGYDKAVPIFGPTSRRAREAAQAVEVTHINPALATARRLTP